jgi:hypothetical protein
MTRQERMSDNLEKIEGVLTRMEQEREFAHKEREFQKEQLEMYRETIDKNIEFQNKEIEAFRERQDKEERKTSSLRNQLRWMIGVVFIVVISGTISIATKPSTQVVQKMISDEDCASRSSVVRAIDVTTDEIYDTFERETEMTHSEAVSEKSIINARVGREIGDYKSRSIKEK